MTIRHEVEWKRTEKVVRVEMEMTQAGAAGDFAEMLRQRLPGFRRLAVTAVRIKAIRHSLSQTRHTIGNASGVGKVFRIAGALPGAESEYRDTGAPGAGITDPGYKCRWFGLFCLAALGGFDPSASSGQASSGQATHLFASICVRIDW